MIITLVTNCSVTEDALALGTYEQKSKKYKKVADGRFGYKFT